MEKFKNQINLDFYSKKISSELNSSNLIMFDLSIA